MNWGVLRLLYIHEMRMLLRSRRAVVAAVVIPAIVMPLMIAGSRYSQKQGQERMENTVFTYAIKGAWVEHARALIENTRHSEEFRTFQIREIETDDAPAALDSGALHFYINTLTSPEAAELARRNLPPPGAANSIPAGDVPGIQIVYRGNQDLSNRGAARMMDLLRFARRVQSYSTLLERGFPSHPDGILAMTAQNVATESQTSGSTAGRFFTVLLVMWIVTAGSIAATDIIAGEKERGTLETLITTAAGRTEIVIAKQLTICSVALSITFIQVLNALVYIHFELIALPPGFALHLSTVDVLYLFALFAPTAAAISAALLIISAYARTYKEAQMHFFPMYFAVLVPALASVLPGIRLRSIIMLVPVANVSVAAREVLIGRPDPLMIAGTVAVMTFTAGILIRFSAKLLVREDIVVPAQTEQTSIIGGEPLFRRRVFQWFAVMWAVMFAASSNVSWLQNVTAQLLFNEVGIFVGCSLLMIRRYRLNLREVLGIHRIPWSVWVAILMAVPAGQVVAHAFFRLVDTVIPTSDALLKEFTNQIAPQALPVWQMYLLMAVLPGICEEFAFRGLLLHGLKRRFHPVVVCLLVGAIFGVFHYTLFRIAPTAFLGVILTAIALMTGSVLPGVLFHAASNGFAIWSSSSGINFGRIDWSTYLAAFAVFGLAMQTIYRAGKASGPSE